MSKIEILKIIDEVNEFLERQMWMDFEIVEYNKNILKIIGNIDISQEPNIEIIFENIFFISAPFEWKIDTSEKALYLLEGEEAININKQFQVEQGYHLFQFIPEGYENNFGCTIGAKKMIFNKLSK